MLKETVIVKNRTGLHARPATILAKLASKYHSKIELVFNEKSIKIKGIIGILSAGISHGSTLVICCDGVDEHEAMQEIQALFANGFGEE